MRRWTPFLLVSVAVLAFGSGPAWGDITNGDFSDGLDGYGVVVNPPNDPNALAEVVDEISKRGLSEEIRVVIGGAPVTAKFADDIGADRYAPDAGSAVMTAKELVQNA